MSKVSVIVVSWNVREQLFHCLQSVTAQPPLDIIVIDNNSSDGSSQMVANKFPQVSLIKHSVNLGFGKAVNIGISKAWGDILLLLNPDATLKPNALIAADKFFAEHPRAGIMGGQILSGDGTVQPSIRKFPSLWSQLVVLLKLGYLIPGLLNKYLMKNFDYHKPQAVDQVSGACFFIRRSLIDIIGKFNEDFWLWFEEVDYCRRAKNAGWEIWYNPKAQAQHQGGASFSQLSHAERQRSFNASLLRYFKLHGRVYETFMIWCAAQISLGQAYILDLVGKLIHVSKQKHQ